MIASYERQSGRRWAFKKGGVAFVHTSDRVLILDRRARYPAVRATDYEYWFDVVAPKGEVAMAAEYVLPVTAAGREKLQQAGLSDRFPAVLHHMANRTYYFAGDFADVAGAGSPGWAGARPVRSLLSLVQGNAFYWRSYVPLMSAILAEGPGGP